MKKINGLSNIVWVSILVRPKLFLRIRRLGQKMLPSLEEGLSITTGRCDLAIATHARKTHKNLFVVVHPEVLDND
jgi:hypothetical protein